jgi:protein-L-isoaspartate(D-aspartate) O-methyltransferase
VLSRLCRKVITVEREPALAERASETLTRLGFANVDVGVADGSLGWPASAPYNIILVACATPEVPAALAEQLASEGRMVIPLGNASDEHQDLRLYRRRQENLSSISLFPVRFVPLRSG